MLKHNHCKSIWLTMNLAGFFFFILGLILFFDRALLAMGNILFLFGVTLLLGTQRTFVFFARRQKWKGSLAFWTGILLILMRWTFIGFAVECYGIFSLFGEFFKQVGHSARARFRTDNGARLLVLHTVCLLLDHILPKLYKSRERRLELMKEHTKICLCDEGLGERLSIC